MLKYIARRLRDVIGLIRKSFQHDDAGHHYARELRRAHQLAISLGYSPAPIQFTNHRYLDGAGIERLFEQLAPVLRDINPAEASGACVPLTEAIQPLVESALRCQTHLTLGYVHSDGSDLFKFSAADLRRWQRDGLPASRELMLHAWLTLPSMEIIDITLSSTIATETGQPQFAGTPIMKHPNDFTGDMSYHPVIVGVEALRDIPGAEGFEALRVRIRA